jgi:iron complex transport system substrate-binding protein
MSKPTTGGGTGFSRRGLVAGAAALAVAGCKRAAPAPRAAAFRAFPAGQPAAILVWAIAPQALLGWPRALKRDQAAFLPPAAAALPTLGMLTTAGVNANLEAVARMRPGLIVDYGNLNEGLEALAKRVRERLGIPYRTIDGRLAATPTALREAGALLGRTDRGEALARIAADLLGRWTEAARRGGPSFYYGRGPDGLETALSGALATEVLEGAGWHNVVPAGGHALGRVSLERVVGWDPEAIVTLDRDFAEEAAGNPIWSKRRSGRTRPILLLPEAPFGWIDRPPSLNRLLGCAWVSGTNPLGPDQRAARAFAERFHAAFYGQGLSPQQAARVTPRILTS